jgi:hypothetical protein
MKLSLCRTLSAGICACGAASVFSVGLACRQGVGTASVFQGTGTPYEPTQTQVRSLEQSGKDGLWMER